ncbi:MAG: Gfo/Idh/MocA family oxidoreductase [Planctomycetes bacterium]|nr:Gfo/Idh/MocA family oxidoreductase [Planctomycetota bacterium]
MAKQYRIGVIGYGSMGMGYVEAMLAGDRWEVAYICEADPVRRAWAAQAAPRAAVLSDAQPVLSDAALDVVGIFTVSDLRPTLIRAALAGGFHVITEKHTAADLAAEQALLPQIESSGKMVAVNLFNRNAWYHRRAMEFIASGQIGRLAIIRICQMMPGPMPGEGQSPEGPPFLDAGLHYVDLARWYAGSEYSRCHAQAVRTWGEQTPWWLAAHGQFANGVVFDITQGYNYGQLAREKTINCYTEAVGTQGVVRLRHDFNQVHIELFGVGGTVRQTNPHGDKKLDVFCDIFARSLDEGKNLGFATANDAFIAGQIARQMLEAAMADDPPSIGDSRDIEEIIVHRNYLRSLAGPQEPSGG